MPGTRRKHGRSARAQAYVIFLLVTISSIFYYLVNNAYASWAIDPATNWLLEIVVYYFVTQPIYIVFLYLMWDKYSVRGLIAAVLLMVSFDLLSMPHSTQSLFSPSQTTTLPNDPNLAPYADWQLGKAIAWNGVLTFYVSMFIYILIPTILNLIALLIVKPKVYRELVESV